MKTYTSNVNCFLIDGEVCIFSEDKRTMLYSTGNWYSKMGIGLLPRDKFVKPKDIEALAEKEVNHTYRQAIHGLPENDFITICKSFFKAGHNANTNEFTKDEMIQAMTMTGAYADSNPKATHKDVMNYIGNYINSLRPLSLPASIQINEQGEIVNVIWNES